jgi:hypothetical protein
MTDGSVKGIAARLLGAGRLSDLTVEQLSGGANNRAYALSTAEGRYVLKHYFRRDRMRAEHSFLSYAWKSGLRDIPEPVAVDEKLKAGICRFVEGTRPEKEDVEKDFLDQAGDFVRRLNLGRSSPEGEALPAAAEACFSVDEHLSLIAGRVERLREVSGTEGIDGEALRFVRDELTPCWDNVRERAAAACGRRGLDGRRVLDREERIISPSDFGFHNAILDKEGRLVFIDFEYAGWDDPAKLICDFFCQPALPVPPRWFEAFGRAVAGTVPKAGNTLARASVLLSPYRVKWCCIVLNHFLPAERERKAFTAPLEESAKMTQLEKARELLLPLRLELKT